MRKWESKLKIFSWKLISWHIYNFISQIFARTLAYYRLHSWGREGRSSVDRADLVGAMDGKILCTFLIPSSRYYNHFLPPPSGRRTSGSTEMFVDCILMGQTISLLHPRLTVQTIAYKISGYLWPLGTLQEVHHGCLWEGGICSFLEPWLRKAGCWHAYFSWIPVLCVNETLGVRQTPS